MYKQKKHRVSKEELEYLESLSAAVLQSTPKRSKLVLLFWFVTVLLFIAWMAITSVDEIVHSKGKIIPFGENKTIQNLEGGIVENIMVKEGDTVKKGEVLLKIKNLSSKSQYETYKSKRSELKAKASRLEAQAKMLPLKFSKNFQKNYPLLVKREKSLYQTNMSQLHEQIGVFKAQITQKNNHLKEIRVNLRNLQTRYKLIEEEISMTEPMVKEGVRSKVDFLKLKREANLIVTDLDNKKNVIPSIKSSITEIRSKIKETKLAFISKSKQEFNDIKGQIDSIQDKLTVFKDSVSRTSVLSPVDGLVKKLYINTIGGVVRPGMDLLEIVPIDKKLIAEVKVSPKDIAFIYPGQKAMVKFTAYNYSIYGGLEGKVISISPDTIVDKKERTFYIVRIKTDKNYLGDIKKPLKIIPGMVLSASIITGKRTILDYILKPLFNSKDYIFTER